MILMGMLGKIGAIFTTIPTPVIGGMFLVMFGIIIAAGIANLQVTYGMKSLFHCFQLLLCYKCNLILVHRHEFLQEYFCFWFFHIFCTRHSKLDHEQS